MLRAVARDLKSPPAPTAPLSAQERPDATDVMQAPRRRTPRRSLVVIIPENHDVSPDLVADRLRANDDDQADVIVACAGHPADLAPLQRKVRDIQVLLVPSGTSVEELRALAMRQAQGDIVTMITGQSAFADREEATAIQL